MRHRLHEAMELRASHMHESAVIAALKIDVRLALEVRVNDCREPVGSGDSGNSSVFTVRE